MQFIQYISGAVASFFSNGLAAMERNKMENPGFRGVRFDKVSNGKDRTPSLKIRSGKNERRAGLWSGR